MTHTYPLVIVTICRDNPDALKVTLASVAKQTVPPSRHIVIDGSVEPHREMVERYASHFGAEYHWSEPDGIYSAMRRGVDLCGPDDDVWFVNATDRLATPQAVETVLSALAQSQSRHEARSWWVGRTAVVDHRGSHLIAFAETATQWERALISGRLGLPHPSVITPAPLLRKAGAFLGASSISEDYRIALALLKSGNLPTPIPAILSVYDQSGVSGRFAWRTVLSKAKNRIALQPAVNILREPFRLAHAGWRALLRGLWNTTGWMLVFRALGWCSTDILRDPTHHFCDGGGPWPQCCSTYLAALPEPST